MKKILVLVLSLATWTVMAQKAEIFGEGGKFGLRTDFGKELLPADYSKITKCATDTLDYYIADLPGSSEIYSYSPKRRSLFDEAQGKQFTIIKWEWSATDKVSRFYGYDKVGNKFLFNGAVWAEVKVKGMIGCKDNSGKYAVCLGGKALSDYAYLDVDCKHHDLAVVKTDSGWIALDGKMKSHYPRSFNEIYDSKTNPNAFVVKKKDQYGVFSLDGSVEMPLSTIKNPVAAFGIDAGISKAQLEQAYAIQRNGKWGVVDQKNSVLIDTRYDNAYVIDPFAVKQHSLSVRAIVKDGGSWKFMSDKWKEYKSVQFADWIGVQGDLAFVTKEGKVWELDLKTFDMHANLYFGQYDDFMVVRNEDGKYGVVGKKGDLLLPFDFGHIWLEDKTAEYFFVAKKNGKDGLYDLTGKNILPHNYDGLAFIDKVGDRQYFAIGAIGDVALGYWNKEAAKMVVLSKDTYKSLSYSPSDKKFVAVTKSGTTHKLDNEGMELAPVEK